MDPAISDERIRRRKSDYAANTLHTNISAHPARSTDANAESGQQQLHVGHQHIHHNLTPQEPPARKAQVDGSGQRDTQPQHYAEPGQGEPPTGLPEGAG